MAEILAFSDADHAESQKPSPVAMFRLTTYPHTYQNENGFHNHQVETI